MSKLQRLTHIYVQYDKPYILVFPFNASSIHREWARYMLPLYTDLC